MPELVLSSVDPKDGANLQRFIDVPKALYQDDPAWVAPLDMEQKELLTDHNHFFKHGKAAYWLARRGDQIVGRISAQIDELYEPIHKAKVGYFGLFECINDVEVAQALFTAAGQWLRERGCEAVHGPFNLSINASCGLLVEGLETPPYMMMGHARPYYPELLSACGFSKAKDLLAYRLDLALEFPPMATKLTKRFARNIKLGDIHDFPRKQAYSLMRDLFNDAWQGNWGFVPFTEEEFAAMGKNLNLIMDPRQAQFAYVDGEPVGMMVTLPDVNEALRGLNGRLLPFGWLKMLWRLKVRKVSRVRVPLMGVSSKLHGSNLAGGVAFMLLSNAWELAVEAGYSEAELSWILEDNKAIKDVIERVGGVVYKRYRIYEKSLLA
ncbi:MAG: hypothetical protein MI750_01780 [Xanthomonadales bacterium]|nr:hypothetical protein [Xanthomonadales bacterium]